MPGCRSCSEMVVAARSQRLFAALAAALLSATAAIAAPIDFTGDLKEIDARPIAKRGRIPGVTPSPRLQTVRLGDWVAD